MNSLLNAFAFALFAAALPGASAFAQTQAAATEAQLQSALQNEHLFSETQKVEKMTNGSIRHGVVSALGQNYPAILIDRVDSAGKPENLLLAVRVQRHTKSFDEARDACRALWNGFDLPLYETRFQILASRTFGVKAATLTDQKGRPNDIYGLWFRYPDEKQNAAQLAGTDHALAVGIPHDQRGVIGDRFPRDVNYYSDNPLVWVDGGIWMSQSNQENETVMQYNATFLDQKFHQTAWLLEQYVNAPGQIPANVRASVDAFFAKNPRHLARVRQVAAHGLPALKLFVESELRNNFEQLYPPAAHARNAEVRAVTQLTAVFQKLYSDPNAMALYCAKEIDRSGKLVAASAKPNGGGSAEGFFSKLKAGAPHVDDPNCKKNPNGTDKFGRSCDGFNRNDAP